MGSPDAASLAKQLKQRLLEGAPHVAEDLLTLVRQSDNPKDYIDYLTLTSRLNGLEPKPDANANLPTFNITFQMGAVQAEIKAAEVIEHASAEQAQLAEPATPAPVVEPFVLDIQPID
jgi:hypothetical protein